jgi:hypothetical protein
LQRSKNDDENEDDAEQGIGPKKIVDAFNRLPAFSWSPSATAYGRPLASLRFRYHAAGFNKFLLVSVQLSRQPARMRQGADE